MQKESNYSNIFTHNNERHLFFFFLLAPMKQNKVKLVSIFTDVMIITQHYGTQQTQR